MNSTATSPGNQTGAGWKVSAFKRTLFNSGLRSSQTIALNIVSIPATAYIIRHLGKAGWGEWNTAASLVATSAVLTNLGLRGKFVRAVAKDPADAPAALAEQLGTRAALTLLAGAIVMICTLLLGYPMVIIQCAWCAVLALCLTTLWTAMSDLLEARQRFSPTSAASFLGGLALTAASVLAVAVGGGPALVAASYIIGPLVTLAIIFFILRREKFPVGFSFHPIIACRLVWESRYFSIQQLLGALNANIALLLLPRLIGVELFGLFVGGTLLITRLNIIPDALGTAFYPMIASLHSNDAAAARRQALRGCAVAMVLCALASLAVALVAGPIARILFPRSPDVCRNVMVWTIWALPLMGAESMVYYALNAFGKEAAQARAAIWAAAVSVSTGVALVFVWGLPGACAYFLIRPAISLTFNLPIFLQAMLSRETDLPENRSLA